ncbi:acylphosphatase [Lactococcus hodotermopsidis]|uniref:acylphosphatase n=1 Tax=Pseudolactococcus hodotermopsidis TaxID=2709157 RepID=A0A6A0BAH6_9LACT|nr:acylphosphatase [Lactococcus hodotermopsidis]GFH41645.1 acylphosphatase [Lactococcus hodotermopsidis]
MKKVIMNVSGRVQGVGFRFATYQLALSLDIKGTVKNEDNGSVTIQAQTDKTLNMQTFINEVRKSPAKFGRVDYLDVKLANFPDFKKFTMLN